MYGCESWIIKKTERQSIYAFELWCWRRLLRVPWTSRRSNQSTLKELSPEYSAEALMLKLKLQYPGHLMQRTNSLEKALMLGKIEGEEKRMTQDGWMASLTQWTWVGDGQGSLAYCSPWDPKESDTTEWMNWTGIKESAVFRNDRRGSQWARNPTKHTNIIKKKWIEKIMKAFLWEFYKKKKPNRRQEENCIQQISMKHKKSDW